MCERLSYFKCLLTVLIKCFVKYNREKSLNWRCLVRSQLVSVDFFIDIKSFRSHYGPGVDSASNRNECQEYFLWVNAAGA